MKLFTVGPTEMFDEVKSARRNVQVPYFRTKNFSEMMLDTDCLLKKFAKTSDSSYSIYLTASGTAAMEATVINCFSTEDELLIINGGTFGQRFVDICEIHKIPYREIKLAYGETLSAKHFKKFKDCKFTALLVNINETSTGQLYDIKLVSDFCREKNMYLIVDAISSFLCDPFEMDKYGVDAMITSSQKGICVEPGMTIVLLNKKITNERVLCRNTQSLYFNFKFYLENFLRGQTPFTPAVGICLELNASLNAIDKKGLENHLFEIRERAFDFRKKIKYLPLTIPSYPLSNALTPLIFKENIAYRVFEILKERYDITVNPTGGILHDKLLRVAHIGNLTESDNSHLADCLKKVIDVLHSNS